MSEDWHTYRTRFLVRAKQLTEPLAFTDSLNREHHGRPGDYLVRSSEGLLRIAPREIFEDVYVPMDESPAAKSVEPRFPALGNSIGNPAENPPETLTI